MDPSRNPFAPGAGAPPPELSGRQTLLEDIRVAPARARRRLYANGIIVEVGAEIVGRRHGSHEGDAAGRVSC